jgi:hypothetical protein
MSIKSKVFAAAATLTLVGGVSAVGTLSAHAATPSCGNFLSPPNPTPNCLDLFSRQFGTHRSPNYVMDVYRQGLRAGQPVILFRASNSDPAEDFTVSFQGTVSEFHNAGLVSNAVNLHYGDGTAQAPDDPAFEFEYSPYGVNSGLCVGVATTALPNEGVTLQPCGYTGRTVWIADTTDSPATLFSGYVPLINGSDTNFSHPFVLTYPKNGFPTDIPRPQLRVTNLTGFSNGYGPIVGTVPDYQLWGADFGVLR